MNNSIPKLKNVSKNLLTIMIIVNLVLVAILGFGVWWINQKNITINEMRSEVAIGLKGVEQIDALQNNLNDPNSGARAVDGQLVSRSDIIPFLTKVEEIAASSSVDLNVNKIEKSVCTDKCNNDEESCLKKCEDEIDTLTLSLNFVGNWSETYYFLKLLDNSVYKINTETMALKNLSDSVGGGWSGSLIIKAYFEPL